jgi:hypothetical protein
VCERGTVKSLVLMTFIGCDYDMSQCGPGDLDPHAVASVFKAYLRERGFSVACTILDLSHRIPLFSARTHLNP